MVLIYSGFYKERYTRFFMVSALNHFFTSILNESELRSYASTEFLMSNISYMMKIFFRQFEHIFRTVFINSETISGILLLIK